MTRQENVAVVETLFAALNAHDLDAAYAHYSPNVRYMGQPRPVVGLDAVRAADAEFFEAFPDHHREINRLVAADDVVAVLLTVTGTNTRSWRGAPATGRHVGFAMCNLVELHDARVISMHQIYDSAELVSQLGSGLSSTP